MSDLLRQINEAIEAYEALDESLPPYDEMTAEERELLEEASAAIGELVRALGVMEAE